MCYIIVSFGCFTDSVHLCIAAHIVAKHNCCSALFHVRTGLWHFWLLMFGSVSHFHSLSSLRRCRYSDTKHWCTELAGLWLSQLLVFDSVSHFHSPSSLCCCRYSDTKRWCTLTELAGLWLSQLLVFGHKASADICLCLSGDSRKKEGRKERKYQEKNYQGDRKEQRGKQYKGHNTKVW